MNRYYLLLLAILLAKTASADQLDGLAYIDGLLILALIGAVCFLILFFSIVNRFAFEKHKINITLNVTSSILIICSTIAIFTLGSSIDPGFRVACLGTIIVSTILIVLNYKVEKQKKDTIE